MVGVFGLFWSSMAGNALATACLFGKTLDLKDSGEDVLLTKLH